MREPNKKIAPSPGAGRLSLVPTPNGNMGDVTLNALSVLRECDAILCEDTRVTKKLLSHHGISKPLWTLHDHNEKGKTPHYLDKLADGAHLALVSDAGTPVISDPGYYLAREAVNRGLDVRSLPGANAALTALTLSTLPPFPSMLLGFCPRAAGDRKKHFSELHGLEMHGLAATYIWHESPHRLTETLRDMQFVFGSDRQAVVVRELTKTYEEILRLPLGEMVTHFTETAPRGEITLLLAPAGGNADDSQDLDAYLRQAMRDKSLKEAVALTAGATGLPRREVYRRALELAKSNNGD